MAALLSRSSLSMGWPISFHSNGISVRCNTKVLTARTINKEILAKRQLQRTDIFTLKAVSCSLSKQHEDATNPEATPISFIKAASIVGVSATFSKCLGLARETAMASAFGVGPVMVAFSYSSLLPTFCLSLLGGVNGPFHTAVTSALNKRSRPDGQRLLLKVNILVFIFSAVIAMAVFSSATQIIDACAPGLSIPTPTNAATRSMAIHQLRIMSPAVVLASLIGTGFGNLSYLEVYAVPSLVPSVSSLCLLGGVLYHLTVNGSGSAGCMGRGSSTLAIAFLVGAFGQWLLQAAAQRRVCGASWPRFSLAGAVMMWRDGSSDSGLKEVFQVLLPAVISSGMIQIATYTDLYFASFIPNSAAALGYANLLAMAPLGILSTSLLVPLLSLFSKLAKEPDDRLSLQHHVRKAVITGLALTLPLAAAMVPLSTPIVRTLLQRISFDASATSMVASLLNCYMIGAPSYVVRDIAVRVFYSLGDGLTPFLVSTVAILLNVAMDWTLSVRLGFGAQGLVLATAAVNFLSASLLMCILQRRMGGLQGHGWIDPAWKLLVSTAVSCLLTTLSFQLLAVLMQSLHASTLSWPAEATSIIIASTVGIASFVATLLHVNLPEATQTWAEAVAKVASLMDRSKS